MASVSRKRKTASSLPSSAEPSSSAAARPWNHDVFLNFRGEDTRESFTSHLYRALTERQITTFMDEPDLQAGDSIPPSILEAIEGSRFAIVVLSQNYASSSWCLEELARIIQLADDNHSRILPVFYEVNPTYVRFQLTSLGEGFTWHGNCERYKLHLEKVKQWRDALRKVASLSGWDSRDYNTDIDLVEAVVEYVRSEVEPMKINTGGFEVFGATRKAMDEVVKALHDDKVTVFGVYGVGGVGKTTMVKHVCAEVLNKGMFHHVITAVVSKSPDLGIIQGTLADMLGLKLEEETEIGRSRKLMQKIRRGNRILIILDDIWERIDLSSIGIPSYHELQRCNSKVLLTTRTHNVCRAMECQSNISLDVLSQADSWTLFANRARISFDTTNFYDLVRKVAKECAGLPIALIAVAKALAHKTLGDKDAWEEAARRLKASQPANPEDGQVVFNCIKLSYDYLASDDARSCFLLCCLFPEDCDIQIEDLLKYGMGKGLFQEASRMQDARATAHSVIKYLRDCSLLLKSEQNGCVKMHDVIRDVALWISSSEEGQLFFVRAGCQLKEWPSISAPEDYVAISLIRNKICKLPEELVCSELHILFIQSNVCLDEIPKDFFRTLNKLRVLDLSQTRISLLPTSFNLLRKLHTLYLDSCLSIINNISELGKLDKLEILSMRDLPLMELPKEIGQLGNLRMLDVTGEYIDVVPSEVFRRLHRLEELYMQCNFADWGSEDGGDEANGRKVEGAGEQNIAAFNELTSLSKLNILKVFISDAKCLPKYVAVAPNWVHFDICISRNSSIRKASVSNSSPVYTRALTLGTTINALPSWFINAVTSKTEKLQYVMCWGLDNILVEYDSGRLHALKYFSVTGPSENLKFLMNTVKRVQKEPVFQNLEELHLVQVDCLKELCVGDLPQGSLCNLRLLHVKHCYDLVDALLPSQLLQRLQNLEKLICEEMDELEYVFECEGLKPEQIILTQLKEMRLENLGKLIKLWKGPAPCTIFQNLHTLVVSGCFELKNLFTSDVAQRLLQLEDLTVECCPMLERIIEASEETMNNKIILPKLKNLALIKLPQLIRFYDDAVSAIDCPLLENLYEERCPQFSKFDFYKLQFNHQQHLDIVERSLLQYRSAPSSSFTSILGTEYDEPFVNRAPSPETEQFLAQLMYSEGDDVGETEGTVPHQKVATTQQPQFLVPKPDNVKEFIQQQQQQQSHMNNYPYQGFYEDPSLPGQNLASSNEGASAAAYPMGSNQLPLMKTGGVTHSNLMQHSSSPAGLFANINVDGPGGVSEGRDSSCVSVSGFHILDSSLYADDYVEKSTGPSASETQNKEERNPLVHDLCLSYAIKELTASDASLLYQDSVPSKIPAKWGSATHPRSRADGQTNHADMLPPAVDCIRDLQTEVQTLSEDRAKCTSSSNKQEV